VDGPSCRPCRPDRNRQGKIRTVICAHVVESSLVLGGKILSRNVGMEGALSRDRYAGINIHLDE
jgi:hypothetical protein